MQTIQAYTVHAYTARSSSPRFSGRCTLRLLVRVRGHEAQRVVQVEGERVRDGRARVLDRRVRTCNRSVLRELMAGTPTYQ